MLATNAEVEEVVTQLALLSAQLVELLLVDDETTCSTVIEDNEPDNPPSWNSSVGDTDLLSASASTNTHSTSVETNNIINAAKPMVTGRAKNGQGSLNVGDKVVVVRKDKYLGRAGIVVGRRGTMFWNVQLDAHNCHPPQLIYKMASSFKVIDDCQIKNE